MKRPIPIIFILAFYFLVKLFFVGLPKETANWLESIYVSSLYIIIGMSILSGGDSLTISNIDFLSVFLLILFGTIFRFDKSSDTALSMLFKMVFWFISILLFIKIVRGEILLAQISKGSIIWMLIGLFSGILLAVPLAYLTVHMPGFQMGHVNPSQYTSMDFIVRFINYQCSNVAIPEEFVFRGLLLGYLTELLEDDNKAYLIQGLVFLLFHYDRLFSSPTAFWISIPISTLLFTLLGRLSRSVSTSIAAHTVLNAFLAVFIIIMAST